MIQAMAREFAESADQAHRRRDRPRGPLPARDGQAHGRARPHGHRGPRAVGRQRRRRRRLRGGARGDRPGVRLATRSSCRSTTRSTATRSTSSARTPSASASSSPSPPATHLGCFALTEPQAGSDATQPGTRWPCATATTTCSTAASVFITNGREASFALVFAQTDRAQGAPRHLAPSWSRRGRRASRSPRPRTSSASAPPTRPSSSSRTAACRSANRLGEEGQGFKIALTAIDGGRIGIAAQALGIADGRLRAIGGLRARAQGVRRAHRRAPDGAVDAGRHGHGDRGRPPARRCAPPRSRTPGQPVRERPPRWPSSSPPRRR